jgi:hypothetical protein
MTRLPQLTVIAWLFLVIASGLLGAARPARRWIVLTPKQQRIGAALVALSAVGEASVLWWGGFFERMM